MRLPGFPCSAFSFSKSLSFPEGSQSSWDSLRDFRLFPDVAQTRLSRLLWQPTPRLLRPASSTCSLATSRRPAMCSSKPKQMRAKRRQIAPRRAFFFFESSIFIPVHDRSPVATYYKQQKMLRRPPRAACCHNDCPSQIETLPAARVKCISLGNLASSRYGELLWHSPHPSSQTILPPASPAQSSNAPPPRPGRKGPHTPITG